MLSRDCDGCTSMKACGKRYRIAEKGDKVHCPDGTAHLIDQALMPRKCGLTGKDCDGASCFCSARNLRRRKTLNSECLEWGKGAR